MTPADPATSAEALLRMNQLTTRSKRKSVQLPEMFLRSDAGSPAMAHIFRAGRAGDLRLKLYLTATMLASAAPYDIRGISGRGWAELLGLKSSATGGARRINDAVDWLTDHRYLATTKPAGMAPTIQLLDPLGTGDPYTRPSGKWTSVPIGFWSNGWIYEVNGPALALLLVVLDMQGGRKAANAPWLSGTQRPRYGLSDDTWTRGRQPLEELGLLTVKHVPQGKDFDYKRMRNTYWVHKQLLDVTPADAAAAIVDQAEGSTP